MVPAMGDYIHAHSKSMQTVVSAVGTMSTHALGAFRQRSPIAVMDSESQRAQHGHCFWYLEITES